MMSSTYSIGTKTSKYLETPTSSEKHLKNDKIKKRSFSVPPAILKKLMELASIDETVGDVIGRLIKSYESRQVKGGVQ